MSVTVDARKTGVFDPSSVAIGGPTVAILGDSITALNTTNTATQKSYYGRGYMAWAQALSGHRLDLRIANNFGVSGDRLDQMAARVSSVIAAAPDMVVVHGGTNDLTNGRTFAQMQADMLTGILGPLLASAIRNIIVIPVLPRTGLTSTQLAIRARFNTWLRELGLGRYDLASTLPAGRLPIIVSCGDLIEDMSNGQPVGGSGGGSTAMTVDGLHPSHRGAYWIGYQLAQTVNQLYPSRRTEVLGYNDIYDATNNPTGNLLITGGVNAGILAGTGGTLLTNTSLTPTGEVATGWRIFRGIGTSTATLVGAKENPRTDLANAAATGERQRLTVEITGAGSSFETYTLGALAATISGSNLAAGDVVYAECKVQVLAGSSNFLGLTCNVLEGGPASPQNAYDGLPDTGNLQVLPDVGYTAVLRTPPITLQSGITSMSFFITAYLAAASGSAGVDLYVSDCTVRKYGP